MRGVRWGGAILGAGSAKSATVSAITPALAGRERARRHHREAAHRRRTASPSGPADGTQPRSRRTTRSTTRCGSPRCRPSHSSCCCRSASSRRPLRRRRRVRDGGGRAGRACSRVCRCCCCSRSCSACRAGFGAESRGAVLPWSARALTVLGAALETSGTLVTAFLFGLALLLVVSRVLWLTTAPAPPPQAS